MGSARNPTLPAAELRPGRSLGDGHAKPLGRQTFGGEGV